MSKRAYAIKHLHDGQVGIDVLTISPTREGAMMGWLLTYARGAMDDDIEASFRVHAPSHATCIVVAVSEVGTTGL
jgi:hypothetical protein